MASAASDESLPQYRSISLWAILAIVLALASGLAVVITMFVAVALAAVLVAVIALAKIAANSETLSGRRLALAALFLAVFFAIFAPARLWMRAQLLQQRAQQLAEAFLDLLHERKFQEAHQLSTLKLHVAPPPTEMSEASLEPDKLTPEDLREFEKTQTIQNIKRIDHQFSYQFEAVEPGASSTEYETFVLRYRIVPDASTGKEPFRVWITVVRELERRSGLPNWKITDMQHFYKRK